MSVETAGLEADRSFANSGSPDGRYRILIEGISDYAIYMLDPDGTVTSWNLGAERFKGYTADEIIGQNFSRFYTEEDRQAGLPTLALQTAKTEGRFEREGWRLRKDGTRFWAHVVIDAIRSPRGGLVGFAKITRDLTERRRAEEELRKSQEQLRLLVQGVTDYAIYMLDLEGRVSSWNAGAQRIKGYTFDEIVGHHFSRFYTEEEREGDVPSRGLQQAATEGRWETEGWRVRKDGSRFWAHVVIDAIRDDAGELIGYAKITRDITERKAAEHELEEARQALFQAQKMEAVGQLTGGIAHDFNNLLVGITGSLEMIERRIAQGRIEGIERFIGGAQTSASRAAALTQRLLAFSRRQTLDPKPTDVNRLVIGMEDLIRRTVGPAIQVEVVGAAGLWPTRVDGSQLENALLNLAINARDAMPEGGRLTIETANKWLDGRAGHERDLTPGQYISVCVSDSGTGIPKQIVDRIFDPFFTTKPTGQGTGLGLSMIHGFVRQSGGQVRVYSEPGQGTTMCLYLPRYVGEVGEEAAALDATIPLSGAGETVLVIDDEPTVRMLIAEVVQEAGYSVLEAEDGPSGLRILQSPAKVDLLVTDVGLPGGMNGRQVADAARLSRPQLKVLFVTGYAENAAVGNGHLDAGMEVITKPFVLSELATKISEMIDGTTAA